MLPVPTDVSEIHAQLCRRFLGATSTSMSVLSEEDAIALALLPANQRYFAEVPERDCRIALITLLLRAEVLPRLGKVRQGIRPASICTGPWGATSSARSERRRGESCRHRMANGP
jgi:hypothetical protein